MAAAGQPAGHSPCYASHTGQFSQRESGMSSKIAQQSTSVATPSTVSRRIPRRTSSWDIERERKYPSSDGRPMAQNSRQARELTQAFFWLDNHYSEDPDVEVCADMLIYYKKVGRQRSLAPDVFVAFGVRKDLDRKTYNVWEEGKPPDWVLEILSASTSKHDLDPKLKQSIYCRMGVREVWLFDPTGELTHPRLKGLHLAGQAYRPLPEIKVPDVPLALYSPVLGLQLHVRDDSLRFWNPRTGKYLLTVAEYKLTLAESERKRQKAEQSQLNERQLRQKAEQHRQKAEQSRLNERQLRQKAEQSRQKAEQSRLNERQLRLKAEQSRLNERQLRLKAEQELEELRRRFNAKEGSADASAE